MNKRLLILLLSFSLLTSTLQAQHDHTTAKSKGTKTESALTDPQFQTGLTAVYKSSQDVKEALILSDAKKAQQAASAVKKVLSQVDMSLLKDKAHTDWMRYLKDINNSLDKIESEDNLKAQRKYFASFNEALFKSLKTFGIEDEIAYYQYCPMALNGEGAYWLSDSKQIRNPYLGDKMLTCGSIKEILK